MKSTLLAIVFVVAGSLFLTPSARANPFTVNASDTVVFDLSQAVCTGNYTRIPVSFISDDSIYALDFHLKYDHARLVFDSTTKQKSYISASSYYNAPDSTVRLSSNTLTWAYQNNTWLVSVYFDLTTGRISASYLNSIVAWLNGDACSVKVIDAIRPPGIVASGPVSFNAGDSVLLSGSSGYGYRWSTGESVQTITAKTTGTYLVTITNVNSCSSDFSMDINVNSTLPVDLVDFNAKHNEEGVLLSWTTASEINNDYFTIERSTDGSSFEVIKTVKGSGNSTASLMYTCMDADPLPGINYYRLRQTDYDQHSTLSKVLAITYYQNPTAMITIYPNPASDMVYLNIAWRRMFRTGIKEADFMIRVLDSRAREVIPSTKVHLAYGMLHSLNVSALSKGVYIVQLMNDSQVEEERLVIK